MPTDQPVWSGADGVRPEGTASNAGRLVGNLKRKIVLFLPDSLKLLARVGENHGCPSTRSRRLRSYMGQLPVSMHCRRREAVNETVRLSER